MRSPKIKDLFSRSMFILSPEELCQFQKTKLGFLGVGMGSVVSELAVRMGFENLLIADGDVVQPSNLNRQNFTLEDCGHKKVDALSERLRLINPFIKLEVIDEMLNSESLEDIIPRMDIIFNFIDWDSVEFLNCHNLCKEHNKTEIFTMNLGFTSACMVIGEDSPSFEEYFNTSDTDEIKMLLTKHILDGLDENHHLHEAFRQYSYYRKFVDFDPQVALASYMSAWTSIRLSINLLKRDQAVKNFPYVYLVDLDYELTTRTSSTKIAA